MGIFGSNCERSRSGDVTLHLFPDEFKQDWEIDLIKCENDHLRSSENSRSSVEWVEDLWNDIGTDMFDCDVYLKPFVKRGAELPSKGHYFLEIKGYLQYECFYGQDGPDPDEWFVVTAWKYEWMEKE